MCIFGDTLAPSQHGNDKKIGPFNVAICAKICIDYELFSIVLYSEYLQTRDLNFTEKLFFGN